MKRRPVDFVMLALAVGPFYLGFLRPMGKRPCPMVAVHDEAGRESTSLFSTAECIWVGRVKYLSEPLIAPLGMRDTEWLLQQSYDHETYVQHGPVDVERGIPLVPYIPLGSAAQPLCIGYQTNIGVDRFAADVVGIVAGGIGIWLAVPRCAKRSQDQE